jgi:hypothetical protein
VRGRWTSRNQVMDDDDRTKFLSPIRKQEHGMFHLKFESFIHVNPIAFVSHKKYLTLVSSHDLQIKGLAFCF